MKLVDIKIGQELWMCENDRVRVKKIVGSSIYVVDIDDKGEEDRRSHGSTLAAFLRLNREDE